MIENLFIGAGAMKAGTTWITNNLRTHKDIYFTYEKEISYFAYLHAENCKFVLSDDMRINKTRRYSRNAGNNIENVRKVNIWSVNFLSNPIDDIWYMNNFILRDSQKYCADFSNLYAHLDKKGWEHVKSMAKNLKVIYIMRDPLSRLWSHVRFQLGIDNKLDLLETWTKEELYQYAKQEHIWRNARYSKIVASLQENLSKEQLHIDFYETIKTNPNQVLNNIEKFLNIEKRTYDLNKLSKKVNTSKVVKKPDFFDELFYNELYEEVKELKDLGVELPNNWRVKYE